MTSVLRCKSCFVLQLYDRSWRPMYQCVPHSHDNPRFSFILVKLRDAPDTLWFMLVAGVWGA